MQEKFYFICHSEFDNEIALNFYDFLTNDAKLNKSNVFCTSNLKQIPMGDNYLNAIRNAINNAKNGMIIALITENFVKSDFCKYELGAAWGAYIPVCPIFFPPFSYKDSFITNSPFASNQGFQIYEDNLLESLSNALFNLGGMISNSEVDFSNSAKRIASTWVNVRAKAFRIDYLASSCGVYDSDGERDRISVEKDILNEELLINFNFKKSLPQFVGYYIRPIIPKDWVPYIYNDFILRFDAQLISNRKTDFYLELKGINYQIADYRFEALQNKWETFTIDFRSLNASEDEWRNMKEICIVLKPDRNSVEKGQLKIRNMLVEKAKNEF